MKAIVLSTMVSILLFAGCVPPQTPFFWGEYSSTLYNYKKAPDDKTFAEHKRSLIVIITESPKKRLPVPPGVYAEYGYMLIVEGNEKEGLENMDKELALYPESRIFVETLKKAFTKKGDES
ncbi:MAG: DUF4810 domain-containing protein [Bacteroidota bacterium]